MDFSNMDWGFLISVASAMVATIKIVFVVYKSQHGKKKRAKLEHHELFRIFNKVRNEVKNNPDIIPELKEAVIGLMDVTEEMWVTPGNLKLFLDPKISKADIKTAISEAHLDLLSKVELNLSKKKIPRKYIDHILHCLKMYKTNFGSEADYIIFSEAHKDRYQMAVMLMDMVTAIITSSIPDFVNLGGDDEAC